MEFAHARRPRGDEDVARQAPRALRAVPDDLTPEERRDWQNLAERHDRRERAEASGRPRAARPADQAPRREGAPTTPAEPVRRGEPAPARPADLLGPRPEATQARRPAAVPTARRGGAPAAAPSSARQQAAPAAAPRRMAQSARPATPVRSRRSRRMPRMAGIGAGPDRLALWAVVLCLFMALVAAATARGDEPAPERGASGATPAADTAQPRP